MADTGIIAPSLASTTMTAVAAAAVDMPPAAVQTTPDVTMIDHVAEPVAAAAAAATAVLSRSSSSHTIPLSESPSFDGEDDDDGDNNDDDDDDDAVIQVVVGTMPAAMASDDIDAIELDDSGGDAADDDELPALAAFSGTEFMAADDDDVEPTAVLSTRGLHRPPLVVARPPSQVEFQGARSACTAIATLVAALVDVDSFAGVNWSHMNYTGGVIYQFWRSSRKAAKSVATPLYCEPYEIIAEAKRRGLKPFVTVNYEIYTGYALDALNEPGPSDGKPPVPLYKLSDALFQFVKPGMAAVLIFDDYSRVVARGTGSNRWWIYDSHITAFTSDEADAGTTCQLLRFDFGLPQLVDYIQQHYFHVEALADKLTPTTHQDYRAVERYIYTLTVLLRDNRTTSGTTTTTTAAATTSSQASTSSVKRSATGAGLATSVPSQTRQHTGSSTTTAAAAAALVNGGSYAPDATSSASSRNTMIVHHTVAVAAASAGETPVVRRSSSAIAANTLGVDPVSQRLIRGGGASAASASTLHYRRLAQARTTSANAAAAAASRKPRTTTSSSRGGSRYGPLF